MYTTTYRTHQDPDLDEASGMNGGIVDPSPPRMMPSSTPGKIGENAINGHFAASGIQRINAETKRQKSTAVDPHWLGFCFLALALRPAESLW
jgi:hypothetical protein